MKTSLAIDLLTGDYRTAPNGERNYKDCPVCGSRKWKLYVNAETGRWFCHAGAHGKGGVLAGFEDTSSSADQMLARLRGSTGEQSPVQWPPIDWPACGPLTEGAVAYLSDRGIWKAVADALYIREGDGGKLDFRFVIPFFDDQNRLIHWSARDYNRYAEGPKYYNAPGRHPLYVPGRGESSWQEYYNSGPLVVVEGPVDAIKVWMAGFPAVCLGGKHVSKHNFPELLQLTEGRETVILLDRDARLEALKLSKRLPNSRVVLPPSGDPGDMKVEEIYDVVTASKSTDI